ncbi:hypothetical protein [Bradyrhizobium sp. WSM471]|uniref:hypothetical protein n=1 Tax=Bradyrhizobium sp. WSM471 TaxID=319017 RepID=UPI0012F7BBFF|nr:MULTISPECIES: hypothetical protein [Bradyrhizobium]UFW40059.1 hypothetical protein BcanWSM471_28140 [Bradyrhizobium canariense]
MITPAKCDSQTHDLSAFVRISAGLENPGLARMIVAMPVKQFAQASKPGGGCCSNASHTAPLLRIFPSNRFWSSGVRIANF